MLQLGFGMTAFESGLVTFIAAVGALGAKFLAAPVLQALGFRRVLAVGVLLSAALTASYGLFTPATPAAAMMALLFFGGVLRSVTFTGVNALAFSDVEDADTGQATAINAVAQQVSLATGVAVGGAVLELAAPSRPHFAFRIEVAAPLARRVSKLFTLDRTVFDPAMAGKPDVAQHPRILNLDDLVVDRLDHQQRNGPVVTTVSPSASMSWTSAGRGRIFGPGLPAATAENQGATERKGCRLETAALVSP